MADLAKRLIFKKIHVAAENLSYLGHFCTNPPEFCLQMIGKDSTYMIHDNFWANLLTLG